MATVLGDAIRRIRKYKKLLAEYPDSESIEAYKGVIKREWDAIKQVYRDDEMHTVYEVHNLHEYPTIYWELSDLTFAMDDITQDLIGLEITIKVDEMRGTDIGRLRLADY